MLSSRMYIFLGDYLHLGIYDAEDVMSSAITWALRSFLFEQT